MTNPTYFHHLGKSWSLDDRDYNLIFSTGRVFIQIFKYDKTYIVRYCFTNFRRWRGGGNYMYVSEARIQQKVRLRRKKERRADSQIGSGNRTVFCFFFFWKKIKFTSVNVKQVYAPKTQSTSFTFSFFFLHCDILLLRGQTEPFETLALTVLGHDANQSNYDHLLVGLIMS